MPSQQDSNAIAYAEVINQLSHMGAVAYFKVVEELLPPFMIETEQALEAWAERCAGSRIIAVDTESDSFHHYREKVCLVQMTVDGVDAIIDPLATRTMEPLREIFEDPKYVKVFHDAVYDLICLRRDFDLHLCGLFDTMVASRLLGKRTFGLAPILDQYFGFKADKRMQRSDWAQRPLSGEQIQYARFDTHFLPQLTDRLQAELETAGRWLWAREEFTRLPDVAARITPRAVGIDPDGFWRVKGIRGMSPEGLGRVRALYIARERIAERLDRPAFKVFGDHVLVEIAGSTPSPDSLRPRPGLRRAGVDRFGKEIAIALEAAKPVFGKAPPGAVKRRRSGRFLDPDARERYEDLRTLRREIADTIGLEPEVALGNAVLEELARKPRVERSELEDHPDLVGWRSDIFVGPIHKLLMTGTARADTPVTSKSS
ncbi:MAG: HRDC domain-containing protein [Clostridia bacterium]|nr:HRDC domain-containing protein [Deltaproteobacteria bacterium]